MLADLVVLGDEPHVVAVDRIGDIDVVATSVGGDAAHGTSAERVPRSRGSRVRRIPSRSVEA